MIILLLIGVILGFALLIYIRFKIPVWKGQYSERLVNKNISKLSDEYIVFNNLLFESCGRSTQIDHVIVSPYGVFVIETKGYKGWILGSENSEYWIQTIYKSKHQFYNPIKQNEGHVRFLRYLLKSSVEIPFIPIVVFNNDADLKVHANNHIVINRCKLRYVISQYKTPSLDKTAIERIVKTIQHNQLIANKEEMQRHKNNVKNKQNKSVNSINQGLCPRCGGKLILRQGKFGTFFGCSNYPECKFTINSHQIV